MRNVCGDYLTGDDLEMGYTLCEDCREEAKEHRLMEERFDRAQREAEAEFEG